MTYIALLRGINVGGNNKIEMKRLKNLFENLGFCDVITYINSGNVIFKDYTKSKVIIISSIQDAILKDFNLNIPVVIIDQAQIANIVEKVDPSWQNDKQQKTDVLFLYPEMDHPDSLKLVKMVKGVDNQIYINSCIVWNLDKNNYNLSGMNDFVKSPLYKKCTVRNINTVRKLHELIKIKVG